MGTEAATLDIAKAYQNSPIAPKHKHYLSIMWEGKIYVQHVAIEGPTTAGGIQGTIADACIALLKWCGITPVFKWVDNFVLFRLLSPSSITANPPGHNALGQSFPYDLTSVLEFTAPLSIPRHPISCKGQDFSNSLAYVSFLWNISDQTVSITEEKKVRALENVNVVLVDPSTKRKHWEVASVHGTLQHFTFVYRAGRHHLAALSTFLSKFLNDYVSHHTPRSALTQLSWWKLILSCTPVKCCPTTLPMVNLDIYFNTSTSLGVGLCVGNRWVAWRLVPGWNSRGHDIGWVEAVALELAATWLAETDQHDVCAVIWSDNKGVIDAFNKGRSRNLHHNNCLWWISLLLAISNTSACFRSLLSQQSRLPLLWYTW